MPEQELPPKSIGQNQPTPDATGKTTEQPYTTQPPVANVPALVKADREKSPYHCEITCKIEKDWWDKTKPFVEMVGIALLFVYTLYTIKMYCANKRAANAAEGANEVAKTALKSVQRAFVATRRVEITPIRNGKEIIGVTVDLGWENDGATPAKTLTQHVSTRWDKTPIPDDFSYPDEWLPGASHEIRPTYIGPKAFLGAGSFNIPTSILKQIQKGTVHVDFWGWARYADVFGQSHLTQSCAELKSNGTGFDLEAGFPFHFEQCPRHNCVDEDCVVP
jgi:hypothetical protein